MKNSLLKRLFRHCSTTFRRSHSNAAAVQRKTEGKMKCWQLHQYGPLEELQFDYTRVPIITNPSHVLVKVSAASVNPLDTVMMQGYGSTFLNQMRQIDNVEFPLILGRDFCGTVISKGLSDDRVQLGSKVWGVVPVHAQGCHAQYVRVDSKTISEKPNNLSDIEAASMLYTGLTAYSGLRWSAGLNLRNTDGVKVLILGAAGGVGSSAVQMLIAGGARVSATCSTNAISLVQSLGVHEIFDYTSEDYHTRLEEHGIFDVILDCAGQGVKHAAELPWKYRNYVSFTTPVLKNFDHLGFLRGSLLSASDIVCSNINSIKKGGLVKWGYFVPSSEGINFIRHLVLNNKMKPLVQEVFSFEDTPSAYQKVLDGHLRGKIVIDMSGVQD